MSPCLLEPSGPVAPDRGRWRSAGGVGAASRLGACPQSLLASCRGLHGVILTALLGNWERKSQVNSVGKVLPGSRTGAVVELLATC